VRFPVRLQSARGDEVNVKEFDPDPDIIPVATEKRLVNSTIIV
jgi:hypothetical protein